MDGVDRTGVMPPIAPILASISTGPHNPTIRLKAKPDTAESCSVQTGDAGIVPACHDLIGRKAVSISPSCRIKHIGWISRGDKRLGGRTATTVVWRNNHITTAAGLSVAIPAVIFHRYLSGRVDRIVLSMEEQALKMVEVMHGEREK